MYLEALKIQDTKEWYLVKICRSFYQNFYFVCLGILPTCMHAHLVQRLEEYVRSLRASGTGDCETPKSLPCSSERTALLLTTKLSIQPPDWRILHFKAKSAWCYSRGPKYSSQHPCWTANNCRKLRLYEIQCPLLASEGTYTPLHIHTCRQTCKCIL